MISPQVISEVLREHERALSKYPQDYPNGTGSSHVWLVAERIKHLVSAKTDIKTVTWSEVLIEEVCEAIAETDTEKLRAELIQVAQVAMAWASKL